MADLPPPDTGLPDDNRGPEILAVCGSLTGIAFGFTAVRFFVRIKMTKNAGWDDWFCLFSWLVVFIEMMLFIPEVKYGAGRHVAYIDPPSNISKGLKINFVTQPLCLLAVNLIKVSIGLFLLRLTPSIIFTRIIKGTIVFTCLACAAHILVVFLQCRPLPFTWGEGEGKCMPGPDLRFASFFNSAIGILTDLIFALIPIPMLYNIQVNWRVKVAVCGILSLGLFATSAAFVKVYYMSNYGKHGDFLYDSTDLTIWTTVETCVGIVAACFPCLKPLFKAILHGSSYINTYGPKLHNGYFHQSSKQNPRSGTGGRSETGFEMYGKGESGGGVTVTSISRKDKIDPDNISEESFLPSHNNESASGIMRTLHVSVHSDKAYPPRNVEDRV